MKRKTYERVMRALWWSGTVLVSCAAAALGQQPAVQAREYQVKAAYLYQFLNFVEWPDRAFLSAEAPFQICVLGQDPFGDDLDRTVRGKHVRARPVEVRRVSSAGDARECHVLFIAESERTRLRWILEAAAAGPALTVSDTRDFERQGGMIGFVLENESVRLRINPGPATAAGLRISSKLLAVAIGVNRKDASP